MPLLQRLLQNQHLRVDYLLPTAEIAGNADEHAATAGGVAATVAQRAAASGGGGGGTVVAASDCKCFWSFAV